MGYLDAGEMVLKIYYEVEISISFRGEGGLGNYKSTGALKESYDALCEKHNDMTFLRETVTWGPSGPREVYLLGVDFLSIDITSDSDFDDEHPAGSSLGDIVKLNSYSLKPYIDSGYKLLAPNGTVYHPVYEFVSELTPEQLILLGQRDYIGSLRFETQPTLSKTHKFTVTMIADDGREFTASIDMEFD